MDGVGIALIVTLYMGVVVVHPAISVTCSVPVPTDAQLIVTVLLVDDPLMVPPVTDQLYVFPTVRGVEYIF